MDAKLKEILLEIVGDLVDLRANQVVLERALALPVKTADAQDAKSLAMQQSSKSYDKLRGKINALR